MIDVVFAAAFAALLISTLVVVRSPASAAILVALGIGVSGVLVQFAGTSGVDMTYGVLRWWLLATLLVILAAAVVLRRRGRAPRASRQAWLLVVLPTVGVALAFVVTRMLAPGAPGPLTGVGYLVSRSSAEDNAKWLNAAAQLASDQPVDAWANVGGPLLLLLTLAATLVSTASGLLYGGVNEVAVSAGTLILSEMLLIVIAPFAVAPLIEGRFRRAREVKPRELPWPLLLLGLTITVTAVTLLLNYGHLTLQFTILVLTLWVGTFLAWRRTAGALVLTTLATATVAMVWFPLNAVALTLLLGLIVLSIVALARGRRRREAIATLAASGVLLVLMWEFLRSSLSYSLGIGAATASESVGGAIRGVVAVVRSVDVPTLPLFGSPGGTEAVSALMAAVAAASVLGAVVILRDGPGRHRLLRFGPVVVLSVYVLGVTLADFWATGTGPGYASNKLTYAVAMPILATTLPIALTLLDRGARSMTAVRWFALGGVVLLLVIDTFLPRALVEFKPGLWPSTATDPKPYWWPAEVRPTADQPLTSNPIGCVYLPPGAEKPTVIIDGQRAYSCTRLLTGIAGQDIPAAGFVQWTLDEWLANESIWDDYHRYLISMSEDVRKRTVILLDENDVVVGVTPLDTLLTRYPPAPESGTADETE